MKAIYRFKNTKVYLYLCLAIASVSLINTSQAALRYNITDLGVLGSQGPFTEGMSMGFAINNSGQVTGASSNSTTIVPHAFVFNGNGQQLIDLTPVTSDATGYGINDSGQVVGLSYASSQRAFITNASGELNYLGTLGGSHSGGFDINNSGQVTGFASTTEENDHAFVGRGNLELVDLGTLGGKNSYGYGINATGHVTGSAQVVSGNNHAFISNDDGSLNDLGTLGGTESVGEAINNLGRVTGSAQLANGDTHAFVTDTTGELIDLHGIGKWSSSFDINDAGQIVGAFTFGDASSPRRAFVTDNGIMLELNTLIASNMGWNLTSAYGINDLGQITGVGVNPDGLTHSFVLTPAAVPVPAAFWLFGSGLVVLIRSKRT
jgi:probable HAF family extracellular repeat protein